MKKILKYLVFVLALFIAVPASVGTSVAASAASKPTIVQNATFSGTVGAILSEYSAIKNRVPGSEGEKQASEYIKNYLNTNTSLVARDDAYVKAGVQEFDFESVFDGAFKSSQNIIYTLKSSVATTKKVIIGCHYDAFALDMDPNSENYGKVVDSASVNGSAGNVATLLALATYLSAEDLSFNVEFVFFGAGESNKAGSAYYATGISDEAKKDIICMININQVALGNNLYFYMNEVSTKTSNYLENLVYDNRIDVEKVNVAHLNKVALDASNELGLDYTHIALDSDNVNFMKEGIETINIFAGDYSQGVVIGRSEFAGSEILTYTANDNIDYIYNTYLDYSIEDNLYEVYKTIAYTLTDADFISVFESAKGSTTWFYNIFANQNLVLYLTVVIFVVFVVIAMFIYYKLSIKAYHANIEVEFLSSVVKISDQIDKTGADQSVAKVVSQVIANDIKKDKVIKIKPKKDKNDKEEK